VDRQLRGVPASPGIASGQVHLLHWEVPDVRIRRVPAEAIPEELAHFRRAVERAKDRLRAIRKRVESTAGPEEAAIFEVQLSILGDRELVNVVEDRIRDGVAANRA
jgi:phosphoenolpyruvate-protein phosphotransferase (PTS system enzyme I)